MRPTKLIGAALALLVATHASADIIELENGGVLQGKVLAGKSTEESLAIELFETGEGLLANEMAPRVHNSGHWTLDGAETSQFENHVRAVTGLPLARARMAGPAAMLNIIGELPGAAEVTAVPGAHLHLYDKAPRPGRKLGHVNITGGDEASVRATVRRVRELLPGEPSGLPAAVSRG